MVKKYAKIIIFLALIVLIIVYFQYIYNGAKSVVIASRPVIFALFLAVVFHLPIRWISNKVFRRIKSEKIRYFIALLIVYLGFFGMVFLGLYYLVPEVIKSTTGLISNIDNMGGELGGIANKVLEKFGVGGEEVDYYLLKIKNSLKSIYSNIEVLCKLRAVVKKTYEWFFGIILSIYMLLDRNRLISHIRDVMYAKLPNKVYNCAKSIINVSSVIFSKFLCGQLLEAGILGVVTLCGMYALSVPYALILFTIVFVANLIPIIGAYIAGALGFLLVAFISVERH